MKSELYNARYLGKPKELIIFPVNNCKNWIIDNNFLWWK